MYFQRCSSNFIDFHRFSSIFIDFHGFLSIFIDFAWISIDFHRFIVGPPPRVRFGEHLAPGLPGRPDPDGENVELSSSLPAPGSGPGRQAVPPGARRGPGAILEGIPKTPIFDTNILIISVWI